MPGLTSPSPATPSPELRLPRAPSSSSSAAGAKDPRSRAPAETKAKKQGKGKEEEGETTSSSSSSLGSSRRVTVSSAKRRSGVVGLEKVAPPHAPPLGAPLDKRRCSWITAHSDPLYVAFHDEEWGVPVHDDRKLFELLTLSQALAELSWPAILNKRGEFRKMFDDFNYVTVAEFTEKKINLLRSSGGMLLSEQKMLAVVANAKKIQEEAVDRSLLLLLSATPMPCWVIAEFGSFSNYCWGFVNHKPVTNGFRSARQVPIRTPKSEGMSKDLMRRGFRCVGPTTVYSFMQVAGIVNDHLPCCFRFESCSRQKADEQKTA